MKKNNGNGEENQNEELFEEYCRELAKANGVPEHIVRLLAQISAHAEEIQYLLMEVEEKAATGELTDKDGIQFTTLAWDYAKENGAMPLPELISILTQFHGRSEENIDS